MKAFLQFLQRAYKYFRNTKRVWCRPPRASLLIIDRGTASPLDEMFAHHNPHVMEIRSSIRVEHRGNKTELMIESAAASSDDDDVL